VSVSAASRLAISFKPGLVIVLGSAIAASPIFINKFAPPDDKAKTELKAVVPLIALMELDLTGTAVKGHLGGRLGASEADVNGRARRCRRSGARSGRKATQPSVSDAAIDIEEPIYL